MRLDGLFGSDENVLRSARYVRSRYENQHIPISYAQFLYRELEVSVAHCPALRVRSRSNL